MSRSISVNENGANFVLDFPDSTPDNFADGVSQLLIGWPTSKVVFHTLTQPASKADPQEQRQCALRLTVPTPVLLELAQQIVGALAHNNQSLTEAASKYSDNFTQALPVA
ncbi:hypothetical protein HDG34_005938 [Paraburkholderia sp. HC6.4b]|uniref:hypothetical protein n=1 Tax=unclassified Paraburkholderia TaxID=2615204 RepID=UPI00160AE342|nr:MULTISPECIES: hypothetical protein [unclassified Paraburkholderia]MBB5411972.1 hypothetical protein [Paraburkholderia sp. HC6.4b]MBB5454039.1 hypothetical protein [Paraburkholderia sp. Kb1A]